MTPTSMRACVITQPGGPEVLEVAERAVPVLQPGEVLIRVQAAGVNGADLLQRRGKYPVPKGIPADILGLEVAGVVVAIVGDGATVKPGDQVAALLAGGGYAEYVAVPAGQCLPWPEGYSAVQAAALPETCCTVWSNVFEIGKLQPGQSVLIHGGASGIGTTALQLARAVGAKAYATVGTDDKKALCLKLGAVAVFNYRTDDFVVGIEQATKGQGVDVILDIVGGSYVQKNLECLAMHGRIVTIATRGGAKGELDIGQMMRKQAVITGSLLRSRSVAEKCRLVAEVQRHVWPFIAAGKLQPVVDSVFSLAQAAEAHRRLESGEHMGKVVLEC